MMRLVWRVPTLIVALLAPVSASAQEKVASDVVVTAPKPMDAPAARHFVNKITALTQDQIARFDAPVCPLAIGFAPAAEAMIVARIRRVAAAVGADVAKEGCAGNVVLVATDDGSALLKALRSGHPELLEGIDPHDVDRLISGQGPVRTLTATALVNEDGRRLGKPGNGQLQDPPTLDVKTASFMNPSSKRVIDAATLVVDSSAIPGKTVIQLADYAVMRTLARTRPVAGGEAGASTILALFDPGATPPLSLTEVDLAYLKALYAMPGNRAVNYQVSRIASQLKKVPAPRAAP